MIPLSELRESAWNPRKSFDQASLEELATTMRAVGVITPLIARPVPAGGYEIAAGHRRRRGAELAGLKEVPVLVRDMDDATFLEVLTIENLQREDVAPLEEADGYRMLIDSRRTARKEGRDLREDVERVAQQIGKSVSYVYQRLKLRELTKPARKRLEEGVLAPGHAILIARLAPKDQEEALEYCVYKNHQSGETVALPVRELSLWIRQSLHCDLSSAPFQKEDASLLPDAGSCTTCPSRARNNPDLHSEADPKKDICTDPSCFRAKRVAFVERRCQQGGLKRLSYQWQAPPKVRDGVLLMSQVTVLPGGRTEGCSSTETAILVDGPDVGKTLRICSDLKCAVHGQRFKVNGSMTADDKKRRAKAKAEGERRERLRRAKAKAEGERRERLLREIGVKVSGTLPRAALELVAMAFWKEIWHDLRKKLSSILGFKSLDPGSVAKEVATFSDDALAQFVVSLAVARDLAAVGSYDEGKPEVLNAMARVFGVDPSKVAIRKQPPISAAKKAPQKKVVQTSAPSGPAA